MQSVAEFLEKAADFDRLAAEATKPKQQQHFTAMASVYRFLAEQQSIIDEQLAGRDSNSPFEPKAPVSFSQ